jgi:uncharacterized repeat protein (TIGR01451 family)
VTVADTLPANVTFVSATGGVTPVLGVLTLDLGIIPIGGSTTVTVVVRPDAAAVGTTITNTATVTGTVTDPDTADNTSTTTTSIVAASAASADLSVVVTDGPDPVSAGNDLTYTIVVTNAGPDSAPGVILTHTLPAGVTFISATAGATPVGGVVTFNLGTLAVGSATVTVVVRPNAAGVLSTSASVAGAVSDPVPANNLETEDTTVNASAAAADLRVSMAADPSQDAAVGQEVTYTIVVTNDGPDPATGVTLTETLDPRATFVSASRGRFDAATRVVTADLGTLASGATATVTIVVSPRAPGEITGTAVVTGTGADPNPANNQTQVVTTSVAPLSGDTTAPTVVNLQRFGYHTDRTFLVVTFSEPLDTATALDRGNYTVRGRGRDGRFSTPDDRIFPIESLRLGPAPNSVILLMKRRLRAYVPHQLTINGTTPGAVADLAANRLDGNHDGQARGNFVRRFGLNIIAGKASDLRTSVPLEHLRRLSRSPRGLAPRGGIRPLIAHVRGPQWSPSRDGSRR